MAERLAPHPYDHLHHFISNAIWEAGPLAAELAARVDRLAGVSVALLAIDDTRREDYVA